MNRLYIQFYRHSSKLFGYKKVTDVKLLWSEHWVYLEEGDKELCQNSSSAVLNVHSKRGYVQARNHSSE